MGQQANRQKQRVCKECGQLKFLTAASLQEHADICKIMNRLGLYAPDSVEAPSIIIQPE